MACGTPVAAYARGALPELITAETGALAEPGDAVDLARAVRAALECRRGQVRAAAVRDHSIDRMVGDYETFYEQQLDAHAA